MFPLYNFSAFHAQNFVNVDQTERGYNVIVAKVGYSFAIDPYTGIAELAVTPKQPELIFADKYNNESAFASTYAESDFVLYKPMLDIVVNAIAYAPMERKAAYFPVAISVGDYKKKLMACGERYWQREALGWTLSKAEAVDHLPLQYEYAFGGSGTNLSYEQSNESNPQDISILHNPIGRGFYSESFLKSAFRQRTFPAHQIDNPANPVRYPIELVLPQGLGCYSRYFASRIALGGTANQNWVEQHAPLLPHDFSMRYWNGAHPDLQVAHFKPNHLYDFVLTGLVPDSIAPKQTFSFQLPVETLFVQLYTAENLVLCRDLILDTVRIDVEQKQIDCTYRRAFPEEIAIEKAELRYILRNERGAQIELAKEIQNNPQQFTYGLPRPPSLQNIAY